MLITSADLKTQSKGDLAQMAKRLGVSAWNTLSKDQLVSAIVKQKKSSDNARTSTKASKLSNSKSAGKPGTKAGKSGDTKSKKASAPVNRVAKSANKPAASKPVKKGTKSTAAAAIPAAAQKSSNKSNSKPNHKSSGKSTDKANGKAVHLSKANGAVASKSDTKIKSKQVASKAVASKSESKSEAKSSKIAISNATQPKTSSAKAPVSKTPAAKSTSKPSAGKGAGPAATNSNAAVAVAKPTPKKTTMVAKKVAAPKKPAKPALPPTNPEVLQRIRELQEQRESTKDLAREFEEQPIRIEPKTEPAKPEPGEDGQQKDRIVLVVRDAYWLHVTWDITRRAVERARAAMAEHWHHAQPILRLLRLDDSGTTSAAETIERDIPIHGGVRNWYIDLNGTPGRFRVMIGYLSGTRFHMLAKSNIVRTPTPGTDATEDHWSEIARDAERIFALSGGYDSEQETTELQEVFEDRLKRSMGGPQLAQYGSGAETAFRGRGGFHFDMEVELYVYGSTVPDGFVTLNNEPVKLRSDGTFSLRLPFPDRRQVLPAVACSRDGVQQRTVVIAVERNTKVMEPFSKEQDDQN